MEANQLEDIILKSVFFARFFSDEKSVKLEECARNALRTGSEAYREHVADAKSGKKGFTKRIAYGLGSPFISLRNFIRQAFTGKKIEFVPPTLNNTDAPKIRQEAQSYLNEINNFYMREDSRDLYLKDLKNYLEKIYTISPEEAFGNLERAKKGLKITRTLTGIATWTIGALTWNYLSNIEPGLSPFERGNSIWLSYALTSLSLGGVAATGVFQHGIFTTSRDLRKAKKLFEKTEDEKKIINDAPLEEISRIMLDLKNEMKIRYMVDVPYEMIRKILTNYKEDKEKRSFGKLLDDFLA